MYGYESVNTWLDNPWGWFVSFSSSSYSILRHGCWSLVWQHLLDPVEDFAVELERLYLYLSLGTKWFRPASAQQTALVGDHFREWRVGHRWIISPHSSSLLSDSLNPPDPPEISNLDSFSLGLPTYFLCLLGDGAREAAGRRARAEQLEAFAARERQAQNIGFLQGRGIRRMGFGMLDVWICQKY